MVGKLYTLPLTGYQLYKREQEKKNIERTRVMPYSVTMMGGWYHMNCLVYTNKDLYFLAKDDTKSFAAKDFCRQAILYGEEPT